VSPRIVFCASMRNLARGLAVSFGSEGPYPFGVGCQALTRRVCSAQILCGRQQQQRQQQRANPCTAGAGLLVLPARGPRVLAAGRRVRPVPIFHMIFNFGI
jgi:hypothetical protein